MQVELLKVADAKRRRMLSETAKRLKDMMQAVSSMHASLLFQIEGTGVRVSSLALPRSLFKRDSVQTGLCSNRACLNRACSNSMCCNVCAHEETVKFL